jgi:hypothetical protein
MVIFMLVLWWISCTVHVNWEIRWKRMEGNSNFSTVSRTVLKVSPFDSAWKIPWDQLFTWCLLVNQRAIFWRVRTQRSSDFPVEVDCKAQTKGPENKKKKNLLISKFSTGYLLGSLESSSTPSSSSSSSSSPPPPSSSFSSSYFSLLLSASVSSFLLVTCLSDFYLLKLNGQ